MATKQSGNNSSGKGTASKSSNRGRPPKSTSSNTSKNQVKQKSTYNKEEAKRKKIYHDEITLTVTLVISLLLILSNFDMGGVVGQTINKVTFGLIGFLAYIIPFILFFGVAFYIANRGNPTARLKIHSLYCLFLAIISIIQLSTRTISKTTTIKEMFLISAEEKTGGGVIGGIVCKLLVPAFGAVGSGVILFAIMLILLMFITGKAMLSILGKKGETYFIHRKERLIVEAEEYKQKVEEGLVQRRQARTVILNKKDDKLVKDAIPTPSDEVAENQGVFKGKKKGKSNTNNGMTEIINSNLNKDKVVEESKYEEILNEKFGSNDNKANDPVINHYQNTVEEEYHDIPSTDHYNREFNADNIDQDINRLLEAANSDSDFLVNMDSVHDYFEHSNNEVVDSNAFESVVESTETIPSKDEHWNIVDEIVTDENIGTRDIVKDNEADKSLDSVKEHINENLIDGENVIAPVEIAKREHKFPPIDLLSKPKANVKGVSESDLKDTARKLQTTLESFGVRVSVTNVSCGPAVTRYELQPEQGVKVSRITALADDIKLNLAAADIRIEAPIPGKAAVGIEVPNKDNAAVMFRELLESGDFKKHSSNIAFAVGKDIGGQTVVTDIGKMPHLLIAGATGSGKSVCINTLIMSILYKANPEDVRMIMIDPKVVELSVYNGIPHLLIPVVTEPKKASAALNWAVVEMTERYNKFAELGVRDINGYNEKIKTVEEFQDERYKKLPQIVIVVDELADLMMVAPGEVEDAICRLAQMARAAGLHLIIATQRPSVNVITGLIKANIPSRIAFSVSSAIDSRTIIDGSGAEKLLGKGDMLFFPSGYPKPIRVQGAFVSDKEVSSVVEFLKAQNDQPNYSEEMTDKITSVSSVDSTVANAANDKDEYFIEAGKFIIEKDKASIGMLQRVYKIGFNRAARIMDQLSEAGVVGPEEGTKPRKVVMSIEEFENYVDEYV